MRAPLATIMLMMALGFVTRYGGTDATLGLAFTQTGWLYPFFATLLGWLGVALTGPTPARTCCSAACRRSPRSSSASTRS
jgi:lactate permease